MPGSVGPAEADGAAAGVGGVLRVPTPTVSVIDFVCETEKPITVETVNAAFRAASQGRLQGILDYCDRPLVSMDFKGDFHSAIVDGLCTMVVDNRVAKIVAWYANEWGYSCRLGDIAEYVARRDREAGIFDTPSPVGANACKSVAATA